MMSKETVTKIEDIESFKHACDLIDDIRVNMIFCEDGSRLDVVDTVFAQHYFIKGLSLLEQAIQELKLAELYAARERAGNM